MERKVRPEIQPLKEFNIPRPVRMMLPNGVPLSIISAGSQEVIRMDILFVGGRWHQSQKLQALFTNRMLREGTRKYTSATIAEKLDYYGSWLELSCSSEYTCVTVYSLNKYVAETLNVVESMIKEPIFPEKELGTILESNIQQFLVNSLKVDFIAQCNLSRAVYGEAHPCGRIVSEEDYRMITPEILKEFHKHYYCSDYCSIFLSGKVTDYAIHLVSDYFGSPFGEIGKKIKEKREFTIVTSEAKRFFTERMDAMQSAVRLGCATITRNHPDYLKLRVLITLFGGYFGSRLMSNIREEKGYTYGISAGVGQYPDSGFLTISTETANEYVEALIGEVYREIDRLHQEPVSTEELMMVKNYMLGEMCRSYESAFSLADAWIFIATSGMDDDYFLRSLQAVNEITPQEIQDLAQHYLCKETLKESVAGKKLS